jgi:prepilin-type N-terminal cleavage/methylation domain-containing protein
LELKMKLNKEPSLVFGFSLIELLVALGILGIVVTVTVSTFLVVLTRSAKVRVESLVENEANYALTMMEGIIRGANEIVLNTGGQTCEPGMDYLRISDPPGTAWDGWVEFSCYEEGLVTGYIGLLVEAGVQRRLTSPRLRLDSCRFDCVSGGFNAPGRVTISFSMSQAEASTRPEERASISFQTVATMRNF